LLASSQVDSFLIGLTGIVYAQLFWSANSFENTLIEKEVEHEPKDEESVRIVKTRVEFLNSLRKARVELALSLFVVTGLYLVSILWSIASMAWTQSDPAMRPVGWVAGPIGLFFLGVLTSASVISSWRASRIELPPLQAAG